MKIDTPENYEARSCKGTVEIRKHEDGTKTLTGMAAVFGKLSENLGGFREIIEAGAFDDTDLSDVRGLFNHDANFILGRNGVRSFCCATKATHRAYLLDGQGHRARCHAMLFRPTPLLLALQATRGFQ